MNYSRNRYSQISVAMAIYTHKTHHRYIYERTLYSFLTRIQTCSQKLHSHPHCHVAKLSSTVNTESTELSSLPSKANINEYNLVCACAWARVRPLHNTIAIRMFLFSFSRFATETILLTMGCRFLTKFIKLGCVPYTNEYFVRILLFDGRKKIRTQNKMRKKRNDL